MFPKNGLHIMQFSKQLTVLVVKNNKKKTVCWNIYKQIQSSNLFKTELIIGLSEKYDKYNIV